MNQIKFYLATNMRRDLTAVAIFASATIAICLLSGRAGGTVRHDVACFWAVASAVYAWFTVFEGYSDPSRSITTLLLPIGPKINFSVSCCAWVWLSRSYSW